VSFPANLENCFLPFLFAGADIPPDHDLFFRGWKSGLERKEPAWYGLLLSASKASLIRSSSLNNRVEEGGHCSRVGRTAG
jgi:hypothetical protein